MNGDLQYLLSNNIDENNRSKSLFIIPCSGSCRGVLACQIANDAVTPGLLFILPGLKGHLFVAGLTRQPCFAASAAASDGGCYENGYQCLCTVHASSS